MTQLHHRPFVRSLLVSLSALALFAAGCGPKKTKETPSSYTPPPTAVKPTASLSADKTSINPGESIKLSWTTTDAANVSISPEVGAVTPQGSTTVTPGASTTYTLTASSGGGNAESSVRISVNTASVVTEAPKNTTFDELFTKEVHDAFFDYDSSDIRPDARTALQQTAAFLKAYPNTHIAVEGHCDERGSTEYNLALGQRRANAVKQYLVSLGVNGDTLTTTSWGKEKPFCTESSESCYQQNRRGHFTLAK